MRQRGLVVSFLKKSIALGLMLFASFLAMTQGATFPRTIMPKNTTSVIKAGDTPEFSFYLPDKASSANFGLVKGNKSIWLSELKTVCKASGKGLQYTVTGVFLNKGKLVFEVLPLYQTDGLIIKISGANLPDSLSIIWSYGAACGKPQAECHDGLLPGDCANNVFIVERNGVILYYPKGMDFSVFYTMFPVETSARLSDANKQSSPWEFYNSGHRTNAQALTGMFPLKNGQNYYCSFYKPATNYDVDYYRLPAVFEETKAGKPQNH